ncbi:winged helix-turn-helix transcriptional regulator [Streptomyces sp. NPDC059096]|uniref:winged helix-turn-helix transcriptional regulator n=1 Tax=Streptomyces sp. NPDC059096 TaxID=3346727 RepID=UPI00368F3B85
MTGPRQPDEASATAGQSRPEAGYEHIDDVCRGFQRSVEIVGKKWNAAVLLAAMRGARRFVDYRARIPGISNHLLSQRLRELVEGHQLIERLPVPTTPVQITYRPTEQGASLMRVLHPLIEWSAKNQ